MPPQLSEDSLAGLPDRVGATFADQTVLVTGGTGFMGKVLVEKLLRKCPDIRQIILLVRPKRGKEPRERLYVMFNDALFEQVVSIYGGLETILRKMKVVEGDVQEADLAMKPEDRKYIIENVDIIVHAAASVRFDEPLKKAVLLNTRGTKLVIELGKSCKKLKLFMHISTAYCHLHETLLEEIPYAPSDDPHKVIAAAELFDEATLETMAPKFLKDIPNSYSYTKELSEALAVEAMDHIPLVILRPSIVVPIMCEPIQGWTDNMNGPMGLLIAAGKGVLRTMYSRADNYADFIPVDILINGVMIVAWNYLKNGNKTSIYNLTSSAELKVTWQELIDTGRYVIINKLPFNYVAWYPGGSMTHSRLYHYIRAVLFHWLPAILVDTLLYILQIKPVLMRVQRRISKGFDVLEYYANNQWDFKSDNGQTMRKRLNEREQKEYKIDAKDPDLPLYFEQCILAARRYILKEPDETIPAAKRHMKIMKVVDLLFRLFFYGLFLWYAVKWTSSIFTTVEPLDRMVEL